MLDAVLASEYNFLRFIRFIFTHDRYGIAQRLTDAVKMVEVYCQLHVQHSPLVSLTRIYVLFADYLQKVPTQELSVVNFLEELRADKGDKLVSEVASRLVDDWQRQVDSVVEAWTEDSVARRVGLISSAKSVILRFLNGDERYMETYENLCSIQKLQEKFNMYVITPQLESKEWRAATLKNFIVREERSLLEVVAFSGILRMSRDEASRLSIKLAIDSGNTLGTLTIVRDALRCVPDASPALAESCVHGCEFVLWRLQEAIGNGMEPMQEPEVVDQAVDSILILSRVLRILEPVAVHSLILQEAVTRMYGYTNIFIQLVNQCMLDDTTSESSSTKEPSKGEDAANPENHIYGVRRRVGVYQMRNEGPLFSRMEAISGIAAVAQSVIRSDKVDEESRFAMYAEQASKWLELLNFLSLSNQDLLEFQARIYASTLPCFTHAHNEELGRDCGLRASVKNVCLRVLQAHPCDLWTVCTLLSSLSSQTIEEVVLELRTVLSTRKSPQTTINFLRAVQFAAVLTQNFTHEKMLTDTFVKHLWAKRLGKIGISPNLTKKSISNAICDFAKHKLDPNVVVEYVDEFCGEHRLQDELLNYALELIQNNYRVFQTMGNVGLDVAMNTSDENELFLLPFFDITVDRIVHILKLINMDKIMVDLISYLRRDASSVAGGFRTIVRAACVLLRAYTEAQLKRANYDHVKICIDLDAVLYGRLLDLAHVDIPLDTFRRQEKSVVVRGLVAPGTRWTPQLAFLIASLIVDNEIADRSVVEMVLNRLQVAQQREMFVTLLKYCRQEKKLHRTKNLPMLWARAVDWSLGNIGWLLNRRYFCFQNQCLTLENVTEELRDKFENWFYFAASCPVEGGRAFDSIKNALRARNYIAAAHMISIVSSFTQKSPQLDYTMVNPEHELVFKWTKDAMKDIPMES
ncbi:hypothetical protein OESDEN_09875 [Oesophagostomum dentatum]|uniref:RZZ complex subunit KNTC1/ROD C-terminal domain-containing protein n=1 Tax=Oesophagostomum dentatum TaxID=61180 RepID=A0A0B1SZ76_OESDE|nr:hypothetical protein OESDEN_09875 [Oesophagostomum dentatum]